MVFCYYYGYYCLLCDFCHDHFCCHIRLGLSGLCWNLAWLMRTLRFLLYLSLGMVLVFIFLCWFIVFFYQLVRLFPSKLIVFDIELWLDDGLFPSLIDRLTIVLIFIHHLGLGFLYIPLILNSFTISKDLKDQLEQVIDWSLSPKDLRFFDWSLYFQNFCLSWADFWLCWVVWMSLWKVGLIDLKKCFNLEDYRWIYRYFENCL